MNVILINTLSPVVLSLVTQAGRVEELLDVASGHEMGI